ncbi:YidB family protein [Ramlibacter sp. Leaf400]|uniref:YidB family protein n=1 Tax=Ramlibacter sp. Leaf400 TaxID=1736365 RepID=UPI0009EBA469|nr:YidB family protein [Ramlibacter sp. Leaf400]
MKNLILGQVLGSIFNSASRQRSGGLGGVGAAGLGGVLASMLGRGRRGSRGALLALLLPLALQWVQRNGGLGAVLKRMQDKGYGRQAQSWVAVGDNDELDARAVDDVVGQDELSRLSQQLGLPQDEVRQGFAELLPEMVNQLTPDGRVSPDADEVLGNSIPLVEQEIEKARHETGQQA